MLSSSCAEHEDRARNSRRTSPSCSSPTRRIGNARRTSARAELERSREQYRLIAETTRAIPFELDLAHGRFTYIGPQAREDARLPRGAMEADRLPRPAAAARARVRGAPANSTTACPARSRHSVRWSPRDDRVVELRWTVSCELVRRRALPARPHDRRHRSAPPGARDGAGAEARVRRSHRGRRRARDQHLGAVHLRQRAFRAPRAARTCRTRSPTTARSPRARCRARTSATRQARRPTPTRPRTSTTSSRTRPTRWTARSTASAASARSCAR